MTRYQQNKKSAEKYLAQQDRITIRVSKESGLKEVIQSHAEGRGESVQGFIVRAILETMERDTKSQHIVERFEGSKPITTKSTENSSLKFTLDP